MRRCLELAGLASGHVAPNPLVGAVLVHDNSIIAEGYHMQYGKAHAEVNCLNAVARENAHLVERSTLYVSLEPCAHFGKTPPCADLIIKSKIPKVVIGCRDPFVQVNGKGMEKLQKAGVEVIQGVLEHESQILNRRFFVFHQLNRPYVLLKWARTLNGKIGNEDRSRLLISGDYTNRMVHRWRSEEAAILVGTNTALFDDPALNNRLWPGPNPIRLVVDMHLRLPQHLKLFSPGNATIIFNLHKHTMPLVKTSVMELKNMGVNYYQVGEDASLIHQIMNALYNLDIQSVMVEGGALLLQSFIDENTWDEAKVITNEQLTVKEGLPAPVLKNEQLESTTQFSTDTVRTFKNKKAN